MIKDRRLNGRKLRVLPQSLSFEAVPDYMVIIWTGGWGHLAKAWLHFTWKDAKNQLSSAWLSWSKLTDCKQGSEPRWRIKTNRPAALRQQQQPHGHIRGGSVSQVNQNKGTGLTQKCQVYSLLLAIRIQHLFQLSRLCDRILFWWKNRKEVGIFGFRSGGTKTQTHRLLGNSTDWMG